MRKIAERYEKTFIEKYGISSVVDEIEELTTKNKDLDESELYKLLPHVGMLYIPINRQFKYLLPNNIEITTKLYPVKVVEVDEEKAVIYEFDYHEKWWNVKTFKHADYVIKGNELMFASHFEAKMLLAGRMT